MIAALSEHLARRGRARLEAGIRVRPGSRAGVRRRTGRAGERAYRPVRARGVQRRYRDCAGRDRRGNRAADLVAVPRPAQRARGRSAGVGVGRLRGGSVGRVAARGKIFRIASTASNRCQHTRTMAADCASALGSPAMVMQAAVNEVSQSEAAAVRNLAALIERMRIRPGACTRRAVRRDGRQALCARFARFCAAPRTAKRSSARRTRTRGRMPRASMRAAPTHSAGC